EGAFVNSAVVFGDSGEAETYLWVFTTRASKRPFFHALVRDSQGRDVATVTEPATISNAFSTQAPGMVALRRLSLPAGAYSASVALTDDAEKPLAAAVMPLQVPALEKDFAVSSLIITRGPAQAGAAANSVFSFGGTALPPRADSRFAPSESLWYFLEIANPADASKVLLEPRLRRDGESFAGLPAFPAVLQPIGPKRYLTGVELPHSTLKPADYILYLTVKNDESPDQPGVLRRADFQIVR